MPDGCAGSLGDVLFYVILHGEGTTDDAEEENRVEAEIPSSKNTLTCKGFKSTHAMMDEMAKSSATR